MWGHWLRSHNTYSFLQAWGEPAIAQYLNEDRYKYGLGFRRKEKEPYTWFYNPAPIAVPYHASKCPNILFGGAAGGTKSKSIRGDAYRHAFAIPGYRGIVMRRTNPELEMNHIDHVRSEEAMFNAFFDKEYVQYVGQRGELVFKCHGPGKDSKLIFGHCQNVGDEERYLGPAYDGFYPDEMATFEKKQIIGIAGRLRTDKRNVTPRMAGASNPGGAHTLWLKDYFIDKQTEKIREENPRYDPEKYQFLPAMLYDNPYYMDPDGTYRTYEDRLFAYDPERRRQLLLGDWSALAGQFFPEFNVHHHVAVIDIPAGCKIERWIDWGYDPHYGICLWVAIFPNGRIYVFYEYKFNGATAKQKMVASEVAAKIRTYTLDEILPLVKSQRVTKSLADPSMWSGDGHSGEDYAETFLRNGVMLERADNDRVMGWGRLRHWLRDAPDGFPWLMFHPRCVTCIRTIPGLVRDKSDPDDVDTHGEDHAGDAVRYGIMGRPMLSVMRAALDQILPDSMRAYLNAELGTMTGRLTGMVS